MSHRPKALVCALVIAVAGTAAVAPAQAATKKKKKSPSTAALTKQVKALGQEVASINGTLNGLKAIATAAPQIVDGLNQLKDGLTKLGSAFNAVEYGVVTVASTYGGSLGVAPAWVSIPFDGNAGSTSGTAVQALSAGQNVRFSVTALVRSNRFHPSGTAVAQGGALMWVEPPPAVGSTLLPCAETGSVSSTPTGEPIQTPDGPVTDKNLTNITTSVPRTSTALPDGSSPHLANCTITAPTSGVYIVHYSASLFDIPSSTSYVPQATS